jgi:hypothetical protein
MTSIDWSAFDVSEFWTQVYDVLHENEMPPRDAESFPSQAEREEMTTWLGRQLTQHAPVGGTVPRRLNRTEYEHTIRDLFGISDFVVPPSFPSDDSEDGFDNVGSGLILSPPLLAEFLDLATQVADEILPPESQLESVSAQIYHIAPSQLSTNEGGGAALAGDRYRLVSTRNMASAAGWTSPFEAPHSGVYKLQFEIQPFISNSPYLDFGETPFQLQLYARQNGEQKYVLFQELRSLGEFEVPSSAKAPSRFQAEIELFKGEVIGFRWSNGPIYSDAESSRQLSKKFILDHLGRDREVYAALLELDGGKRGASQIETYEAVQALLKGRKLDLEDPRLDTFPEELGGGLGNGPHNWVKAFVSEELHRYGPALDVLGARVEGPLRLIEDEKTRIRRERSQRFLGERLSGQSDEIFAKNVLQRFLSNAFRRPVSEGQLETYMKVVGDHRTHHPDARIEDALHLAVRRALVSPSFLYRSLNAGKLDDWDLASRLSYFLTSAPPDERLRRLAEQGVLSSPKVLEEETRRVVNQPERERFVQNFTGQWLGTRMLKNIMPDPRLFAAQTIFTRNYTEADREAMIAEVEMFFDEILLKNHSVHSFIDPGFSYRNRRLNQFYDEALEGNEMRRITFPKGTRQGGILGLASIMMATANGVDTHPVHRGVWLLENVFGQPTPDPPPDIPAVAPDTSGTTTMREQMQAHTTDPICARCHDRIDPLGFVMENFDPIGRWRENYPIYTDPMDGSVPLESEFYANKSSGGRWGPQVDASGILPDGTPLGDVTDLKQYLVGNIDLFAHCLTEKMMVYGTGRSLGFGDRRVVARIVYETSGKEFGFQDLIVAIVCSESFRIR